MSGIFNTVDENRNKDIIVATVLKVGTEEIEYWTNMTCFYDKTWEFDPALSTTPIAFMHITSITESIEAQGAEKRVILYEAPTTNDGFDTSTSHPAYKNNLEVIMDNVVVKPKQYQMEVIIPDSLIGPYHKQGLARLEALLLYMDMADTTGSDSKLLNGISSTLNFVQSFLDTVETATSLIDTILGATLGSSQMSTINKNSLQAMASKGHVVLFKKWTGYDYSYGLITKIDISKKPTEEGVYRGSITFQETPILNISQKKVSTSAIIWEDAARYGAAQTARVLNLALALPFMSVTGVVDEAGAPGTKNATGSARDLL